MMGCEGRWDGAQEVMESMVEVLLSRNIRAQQIAAAAIADICVAAPRLQGAFLRVRRPPAPFPPAVLPAASRPCSMRHRSVAELLAACT